MCRSRGCLIPLFGLLFAIFPFSAVCCARWPGGASKLPVTCSVLGACSPRWSPGCALREQHPDLDAGAEQVGEALRTLEAEEAKVNAEAHAVMRCSG